MDRHRLEMRTLLFMGEIDVEKAGPVHGTILPSTRKALVRGDGWARFMRTERWMGGIDAEEV